MKNPLCNVFEQTRAIIKVISITRTVPNAHADRNYFIMYVHSFGQRSITICQER